VIQEIDFRYAKVQSTFLTILTAGFVEQIRKKLNRGAIKAPLMKDKQRSSKTISSLFPANFSNFAPFSRHPIDDDLLQLRQLSGPFVEGRVTGRSFGCFVEFENPVNLETAKNVINTGHILYGLTTCSFVMVQ